MLRLELGDLKELGFDLTLTGFDEVQLGSFLADKTEGLTDPDDVPPVPEHPVTQPGDLWLLGRHKLLCGDSTAALRRQHRGDRRRACARRCRAAPDDHRPALWGGL